MAATPKAVKSAYDNAEKRLQKDQNGRWRQRQRQ
ncbi:tail fiber protein [Escherichia coli]|nr:tail fiber protein [Escherichia coli]MCZ5853365.1 tail fiber protein [Escherichia coli]